jgi:hypothetical protein
MAQAVECPELNPQYHQRIITTTATKTNGQNGFKKNNNRLFTRN